MSRDLSPPTDLVALVQRWQRAERSRVPSELAVADGALLAWTPAAPAPAEMPSIEVGDWVEDVIRLRRITADTVGWWQSSASSETREGVKEIRKANGQRWVRGGGK
jgi:hypothetical protein